MKLNATGCHSSTLSQSHVIDATSPERDPVLSDGALLSLTPLPGVLSGVQVSATVSDSDAERVAQRKTGANPPAPAP